MSEINCSACDELRTEAPDFATNGVTSAVCASLKNDTGLSASNGHNNETDMSDAVDCLIGRMDAELEAYDQCDWKEFMHKWIPNNYETLKAMLCSDSGQWGEIHDIWEKVNAICPSLDSILSLIRGDMPKWHDGYWLQSFLDKVTGMYSGGATFDDVVPTVDNWKPSFCCDILNGGGCDSSKRLGRYRVDWHRLVSHYPYTWGWQLNENIPLGTVIGVVPMSAVVGEDFSEARWKNLLRSRQIFEEGTMSDTTAVYVSTLGYVTIDGVTFNSNLSQYGENNMCILWGPMVGGNTHGTFNGGITLTFRTYET